MHTLFATQRIFLVTSTNPGTDSAFNPSYSAVVTRLLASQWDAAADLGSSNIVGQSDVQGANPPG
jgi:hypothetical protein